MPMKILPLRPQLANEDLAMAAAWQLVILSVIGVVFVVLWNRVKNKSFLQAFAVVLVLVLLSGLVWQFIDHWKYYGQLTWECLRDFLITYLSEWTLVKSAAYGIPTGLFIGFYFYCIVLSFQDEP